jgi:hypothetical protein
VVTVLGLGTAWLIRGRSVPVPRQEFAADDVVLALLFPVIAIVVGLVACLERPRSGVKRTVSLFDLLPVILSGCVTLGWVSSWAGWLL